MKAVVAVIACTTLFIAGCSSSAASKSAAPKTIAAQGHITVDDSTDVYPDDDTNYDTENFGQGGFATGLGCHTLTGYPDVAQGAEVVISDDGGATLAIAHLSAGVFDADGGCAFKFSTRVPGGKGFYGVEVTHRGVVKIEESKLGAIALTLGG